IADAVPISDRQLYILGKKIGATNVLLYGPGKRLIGVVDVEVKLDTRSLGAKIREASGGRDIEIDDVDGKLVLKGSSGDSEIAERAVEVAKGLSPGGVVNALKVTTPQQVLLKVRFVEVNRSAARNFGIRWQIFSQGRVAGITGTQTPTSKFAIPNPAAAGFAPGLFGPAGQVFDVTQNVGGGLVAPTSPVATILTQVLNTSSRSIDLVLSALEENQVLRRLAEPNLIALSGEEANFLAGGEYPVPVVSGAGAAALPTITIIYKEFGVKLNFRPTVLSRGVISLKLFPEVSDLDNTIGVTVAGTFVPGLVVRRAKTTVELRDGQSFAIAGLLQSRSFRDQDQFPWIGSVPILGSLFRSSQYLQNETELVVLVTPYLIKPVPPGKQLTTPLETSLPGNDMDLFLFGRPEIPKTPPAFINAQGQDQSDYGAIAPGAPGYQPVPPVAPAPAPVAATPAPPAAPEPAAVPAAAVPPPPDGALYYDPATGRFIDPPGKAGGQ
ncbi:MAG: pilus assembly protein N-terminal domain-containing protein, partial [Beijerinckiaceae bacterium]|nr:pilus assembly protein N-terminal domain-containing protein [Beijerinckiaceae bacterium]